MSKIPGPIKKAASAVAGAANKVGNTIAAPARGAALGVTQAQARGKTGPAVAKKAIQGFGSGFTNPKGITAAHKMATAGAKAAGGAPKPAAAPIQVIKKAPGAVGTVNFKGKKPNA